MSIRQLTRAVCAQASKRAAAPVAVAAKQAAASFTSLARANARTTTTRTQHATRWHEGKPVQMTDVCPFDVCACSLLSRPHSADPAVSGAASHRRRSPDRTRAPGRHFHSLRLRTRHDRSHPSHSLLLIVSTCSSHLLSIVPAAPARSPSSRRRCRASVTPSRREPSSSSRRVRTNTNILAHTRHTSARYTRGRTSDAGSLSLSLCGVVQTSATMLRPMVCWS